MHNLSIPYAPYPGGSSQADAFYRLQGQRRLCAWAATFSTCEGSPGSASRCVDGPDLSTVRRTQHLQFEAMGCRLDVIEPGTCACAQTGVTMVDGLYQGPSAATLGEHHSRFLRP